MKKFFRFSSKLEIGAFISGFCLMVFELAAARVLAPSIGSSTYVWTSVIGVIIAALSVGYYVGGKIADARNVASDVAIVCLLSALSVGYVIASYVGILEWVVTINDDARIQGMIASTLLFAPTSLLLGILSPYLAKLNITSLASAGNSVANLSALNSVGGIVGTFITGFILFGYIGSRETFAIVVILLLILSWLFTPRYWIKRRIAVSIVLVVLVALPVSSTAAETHIDTPTAHYVIYNNPQPGSLKQVRGIATGSTGVQSGIYINQPDELLLWYTQQVALAVDAVDAKSDILVLGGGTFTLPRHLAKTYPASTIDVVEIDPALKGIAEDYFGYTNPKNVSLIFNDARSFINQNTKKYDIIIVDIYNDTSVPFSLMTKEYGDRVASSLTKNGVTVVNMIAGQKGACGSLLSALDAPYRQSLPAVTFVKNGTSTRSNIVLAYSRSPVNWTGSKGLSVSSAIPYTDNYAPAERLQQACLDTA